MTPYKQLNHHDPDNGIIGDCYRTAIACLLDLPPDALPNYCEGPGGTYGGDGWYELMVNDLNVNHGIQPVSITLTGDSNVDDVLEIVGSGNEDAYWILCGESGNGTDHVVVCLGNKIVWDPILDDSGIVGPTVDGTWEAVFYIPVSMTSRSLDSAL